jgi:hypothetical protein
VAGQPHLLIPELLVEAVLSINLKKLICYEQTRINWPQTANAESRLDIGWIEKHLGMPD